MAAKSGAGSRKPRSVAKDAARESAKTAVATVIARLGPANGALQAVTAILRESAALEAGLSDARAALGYPIGPVDGLPFVVKDIIDVGGVVSGCGSLTRRHAAPAARDAHVVRRLRAAGAIPVAKTHTVEYAFGGFGTNLTIGTPWNPWDLKTHRIPGGSSSGTGVVVGAGLVPAGLGTDTGGSVRIPAGLCGCVGLKTSTGLVGRSGVAPLSQTLDTIGPLARDVTTAARMLAAMQGFDPEDASTAGVERTDPLADLERGISGLRIGRIADADLPLATDEVRADFAAAVQALADAGARIEPFTLPQSLEDMSRANGVITASEGYRNWRHIVDDPAAPMAAPIRARFLTGKAVGAADYLDVLAARDKAIRAFLRAMDRLDAIVLPTMPFPAIPVAEVDEQTAPMGLYTRFANYLTLAGLAVPTRIGREGLPLSLQIVVRRFDDGLTLRIGRAYETIRGAFPLPRIDA